MTLTKILKTETGIEIATVLVSVDRTACHSGAVGTHSFENGELPERVIGSGMSGSDPAPLHCAREQGREDVHQATPGVEVTPEHEVDGLTDPGDLPIAKLRQLARLESSESRAADVRLRCQRAQRQAAGASSLRDEATTPPAEVH